eukprot:TRINITY_DN16805_c0_g1_i1.p2 TRINITY_DN16805_c0_g1~~TRINITY_DN16805_c0_g1_i1.p2  ORF type:complete len:263 (-),score=75.06 TRINITY_DN16805_c0_g1_i1:11-799(-)
MIKKVLGSIKVLQRGPAPPLPNTPTVPTPTLTPTELSIKKWNTLFSGPVNHYHSHLASFSLRYPTVCFLGISNTGKSSLLNALFNNKKLARVSKTPGMTLGIHLYTVRNAITIADMPGYGYAQIPTPERAKISQLIKDFLTHANQNLKLVCLLVDIKRGLDEKDLEMMKAVTNLYHRLLIILTKVDRIGPEELKLTVESVERVLKKEFPTVIPTVVVTSAKDYLGIDHLKCVLLDHLAIHQTPRTTNNHLKPKKPKTARLKQ